MLQVPVAASANRGTAALAGRFATGFTDYSIDDEARREVHAVRDPVAPALPSPARMNR